MRVLGLAGGAGTKSTFSIVIPKTVTSAILPLTVITVPLGIGVNDPITREESFMATRTPSQYMKTKHLPQNGGMMSLMDPVTMILLPRNGFTMESACIEVRSSESPISRDQGRARVSTARH